MLLPIRAFISAFILVLSPAAANAQTQSDTVRIYANWSLEVSQHGVGAIGLMETANEALVIASDFQSGTSDLDTANASLNALTARLTTDLNRFSAEAQRLSAGPSQVPPSLQSSVPTLSALPVRSTAAVRAFIDTTLEYAEQVLAGEDPDPIQVDIARFGVLQSYYSGLMTTNISARDGIDPNFPQHHLLDAYVINGRSTILAFELARQAMGAAPSGHAEDDITGQLADNQAQVRRASELATARYRQTLDMIDTNTPAALGATEQQIALLRAMMETYPLSIQAELDLASLFLDIASATEAIRSDDWTAWDSLVQQMSEYEAVRERQQMERQRLGTAF